MNFETVIGLEVHVELKTQSKIFSSSPTPFGAVRQHANKCHRPWISWRTACIEQRSGELCNESDNGAKLRDRNRYKI